MRSYLARLASETPPEPKIIFAITAALGFAALGLRIAAWAKKRRESAPAAAPPVLLLLRCNRSEGFPECTARTAQSQKPCARQASAC